MSQFDEAMDTVELIRGRGHLRVVIKESVGVAGSNAIRLWEPEVSDAQKKWIKRALEIGGERVLRWRTMA